MERIIHSYQSTKKILTEDMLKRCRIKIDVETINRTSFLESEPLVHCKEQTMLTGKIIINKKVRNPT
jgi:hypothetical protein